MRGRGFTRDLQRLKYVLSDFITTSLAFFVFNIARYYLLASDMPEITGLWHYLKSEKMLIEQFIIPLSLLSVYWLSGYYNNPMSRSRLQEVLTTFYSAFVNTIIIFLLLLINDRTSGKSTDYLLIIVLFVVLFIFTYIGRIIITTNTLRHLRNHHWFLSTLIIGFSDRSLETYKKLIKSDTMWSYNVVGFIRIDGETKPSDGYNVWDMKDIREICDKYSIDQIIISPSDKWDRDEMILRLLDKLLDLQIPVKIQPDNLSFITAGIRMTDIMEEPFVDLTRPRISECERNMKRTFDIIASVVTLIILSPLLLAIALAVKFDSKGPVLYVQRRVGRRYREFNIFKFRSMRADAEKGVPQLSSDNDDRITRVGHFLRKYRLDELPQFFNVIRGDMSLVGPRPERDYFIRQIMKSAPYYCLIFQVRPGITSWGMVKFGYASNVDEMVERTRYDLLYINNMSLPIDLKIMIYTLRTVFKGMGK